MPRPPAPLDAAQLVAQLAPLTVPRLDLQAMVVARLAEHVTAQESGTEYGVAQVRALRTWATRAGVPFPALAPDVPAAWVGLRGGATGFVAIVAAADKAGAYLALSAHDEATRG